MAKSIEEMRKEAAGKWAVLTADEFLEKSANVTSKKPFSELIREMPSLIMVLGLFSAALCHEIFDEETKTADDETTEESEATE